MATRYFKSTDGKITAFRASKTRAYRSSNPEDCSFSAQAANPAGPYLCEAIEISKAEYDALSAMKVDRVNRKEGRISGMANSPGNSWVFGVY